MFQIRFVGLSFHDEPFMGELNEFRFYYHVSTGKNQNAVVAGMKQVGGQMRPPHYAFILWALSKQLVTMFSTLHYMNCA
jgi:hypothetical protein